MSNTSHIAVFSVLTSLALATPAFAQDETVTPEIATETVETAVAEAAPEPVEAVAEEVVVAAEETVQPDLEQIAATDPALEVRTGEDGEVDAMVMLSDVTFEFGTATLEPAAIEVLKGIAAKLGTAEALEIAGHTDAIGEESYNEALGLQRAEAVRDWLIENSELSAETVVARSAGEASPIAPNLNDDGSDNPDGRALNRRVEFVLPDEAQNG